MRQAPAHNIHRFVQRALRRQRTATLQVLARLDPKSIERSTIIGISLFAASSIALQGFVVAQGNLSGKTTGVAQAAVAPSKRSLRPVSETNTHQVDLRQNPASDAAPAARRGDRLTDLTITQLSNDDGLPQIASIVPADTIIAKPVTAVDLGLRVETFTPTRLYASNNADGLVLSSRRTQEVDASLPRPTRVAFAGAARSLGHEVTRDSGEIIDVTPPRMARASAAILGHRSHVRRDILQKVHFQDDTPDRCLPTELMNVIYDVAEKFGEVQILSTFRDPQRNRRVGGAPRSFHLRCQAIDFRVMGPQRDGLLEYLEARADVGGLKRYPLGFFHIDTGARRTW